MHKKFKIAGLLAVLLSAWTEADAAGLGRLTVQSALGQPLKAEIELYSVTRDELPSVSAKLASSDAFRQARLERMDVLNGLRFSVEQRPNGQPIVRISSSAPVSDPFVDLLIELNWASGRLLREYTLLLDPPVEAKPAERPAPSAPPVTATVTESKPAEPAKASAAEPKPDKPMAKEYGPVKQGETLRAIAIQLKTGDATTEQMMVGLFQANKEAFADGNMNRLKKGEVLKVPDFESLMLTASPSQARQTVREQASAWRAGQPKLGEEVSAAKDKAAATGKIEPSKPEAQPSAAAPAKDVLKLSKGEPATGSKADAKTAERLHAMEEDLAAKSRALKEAQDRVAQLEKTVKDLQRLVELKGQQAAAVPVPEAKPAEPPVPAVPSEAAKPVPPPAPAPAPVPEASLIDEILANPLYMGGGLAGVLLLALAGISISRRRKQKAAAEEVPSALAGGDLFGEASAAVAGAATAAAAAAVAQDSGVLTDFSRLGLGAIDTQEIDPIAEAEVYLAYGKEAQAEEILRDALAKHPDREDVLLKLLEIYHGRKDIATYEATARNLQTALGGNADNASWIKAAEMGREIDPGNPLYVLAAAMAQPMEEAMPAEPAEEAAPEPVSMLDLEIPAMESLEMPADFESEPAPASAPETAAPESPASVLPMGLDFEFSMSLPGETETAAEPEPESQALAEEMPSLDFPTEPMEQAEAGVDVIDTLPALEAETAAEPEPMEMALPEAPVAMEIEPGFEAPEAEPEPEPEEIGAPPASKLPDLDFGGLDLELSTPAPATEAAAEQELPDLDIGDLDFAGEEAAQPAEAAAEAAEQPLPDLEPGDLDLDMAEASAATEEAEINIEAPISESEEVLAEVNTKLDLARAYIEMGDKEGAREILEEVLKEGSSEQVEEANKLLSEAG
ncbi:MAG: hypothetical protein HY850_12105 [Betaproteobacteria bacterium]|nr:hypothetical protein [Betaproteobacteria bacterium]